MLDGGTVVGGTVVVDAVVVDCGALVVDDSGAEIVVGSGADVVVDSTAERGAMVVVVSTTNVVVDSSDDPAGPRRAVEEAARGAPIEVTFIEGPRGASRQRNVGIEFVRADIVMFPDDDSLWAIDTAEEFLRVYDLDTAGEVGAVCGRQVVGFDAIDAIDATAEAGARYRISMGNARPGISTIGQPAKCAESRSTSMVALVRITLRSGRRGSRRRM